jgi:nucleoside-diphosphate-sugar epimerase
MMVFQAALAAGKKGEKFEAVGNQDARFGTIHQDDLADLFLRVAERVSFVPEPSIRQDLILGTYL